MIAPEICLISVPHNGTGFVCEMFKSNGWEERSLNGRPNPAPTLFHGHCEKVTQCLDALDLGQRMPIVMPLRHPYRVEESWRRRGKLHTQMMTAYNHMFDLLEPYVTVWVPLDGEPWVQQRAHVELSAVAQTPLKIDWETLVHAEMDTHAIDVTTLNPSPAVRDMRKRPLFVRYYGQKDS